MLYIFEGNEAVIKMIIKGRSPTIRHVSRTRRVALDWLLDRINLDSKILIKIVDTKKPKRRHTDKGQFHTWWVEQSSPTVQCQHFQLSKLHRSDVEKNATRNRKRENCGEVEARRQRVTVWRMRAWRPSTWRGRQTMPRIGHGPTGIVVVGSQRSSRRPKRSSTTPWNVLAISLKIQQVPRMLFHVECQTGTTTRWSTSEIFFEMIDVWQARCSRRSPEGHDSHETPEVILVERPQ